MQSRVTVLKPASDMHITLAPELCMRISAKKDPYIKSVTQHVIYAVEEQQELTASTIVIEIYKYIGKKLFLCRHLKPLDETSLTN